MKEATKAISIRVRAPLSQGGGELLAQRGARVGGCLGSGRGQGRGPLFTKLIKMFLSRRAERAEKFLKVFFSELKFLFK